MVTPSSAQSSAPNGKDKQHVPQLLLCGQRSPYVTLYYKTMCVCRTGLSGAGDCFRLSSSRLTTHAFTSIGLTLSLRPHAEQSRMSTIRNDANIVRGNLSRKLKTPMYPFSPPPTFVLPATTQSCLHQSYQAPARCFARLSICSASLTEDGCTVSVCFSCKQVGTYLSFRNPRTSS
jgi:hypothetical protein